EYSAVLPSKFAFDKLGSRMAPNATPNSAVGNPISRSAYDSHDTLPLSNRDSKYELLSSQNCAAETANTAGPILRRILRTPASPRLANGLLAMRGSMPIFSRAGI